MYLYDKFKDKINVYETSIDNELLKEYKKKFLNDIFTARIITNNKKIKDHLFKGQVLFSAVDRVDEDGNISYINLTDNKDLIESYINGDLDKSLPLYINGDPGVDKAFTSKLENTDYVFLFSGGGTELGRFRTDESVLLKGPFSNLQPILYDNLCKLDYLSEYDFDEEFFRMMSYKKVYALDYKQMEFADKHELAYLDLNLEEKFERSNLVLSLINKAH